MAPKIFITGATGYIGGDALFALLEAHPDYDITCLIRSKEKAAAVAAAHPRLRLVYNDLDATELITEESRRADIVLSAADADHEASVAAMADGLAQHEAARPGYLIHTSGTGLLLHADMQAGTLGVRLADKVYDDWAGVAELVGFPDAGLHRGVDKRALAAAARGVRVAVVSPPAIYGAGRGPVGRRSIQVPDLARATLERQRGLRVNEGLAWWNHVHVADLSDLYVKLVEAAVAGGGAATWGAADGYYFAESGEHVWRDLSESVLQEAVRQGFIPAEGADVESIAPDKMNEMLPWHQLLWGGNSRGKAIRAKKLLSWSPKAPSLHDEIPMVVRSEAERLGLVKHHAEVAAGKA